jgi:hypothetical protein
MSRLIDLTGRKFGRLTVLSRAAVKNDRTMWNCRCDCGLEHIAQSHHLLTGHTKSCGCATGTLIAKSKICRTAEQRRLRHILYGMKQRCNNPENHAFQNYGGRGIKICNEWVNDFDSFYNWAVDNGYNNKLSIDRIDNDKGYSPDNCRWADKGVQGNNRRTNHTLTVNNKTLTLTEWAKKTGIKQPTIRQRIKNGWYAEEAVGITPRKKEIV